MTSEAVRRAAVPIAAAVVVLAVVLTVVWLAGPSGEGDGVGSAVSSAPGDVPTSAPGGGDSGSAVPTDPRTTLVPNPDLPSSRFTSVQPGSGGAALDVSFWGGVEECYEYTVRAEEKGDVVTLSLGEQRTFEGACIDLAQEYDRTVPLTEPLGARRVVDALTGDLLLAPSL